MEVIKMSLLESGENYLETILVLTKRNGSVRSIDIAEEINFTKASVSRAMSILKRDNYIIMEPDGRILLTKDGQKKAAAVYDRHVTLTRFINELLGVDEKIAEKDACRIEHIISPETFAGIKGMLKD
ncbi:iron dependent repressor DNA binding domain protein [Phascolarctobacterium succinatutens YIT 12067]|uniref:Iron dependent repressor DNA binding domain protein n=1 Tax=Phascolarctobacterium succinatutens YIT 12067 TaxID=626939 RepID=E8LD54_9FIRM|nr:iron dependent repressor DNA binding domain protein [Phascolarctobacterium succinatutens YIT 12067]